MSRSGSLLSATCTTAGNSRDRASTDASPTRTGTTSDGALDSSALRISWNPAPQWSLQASWARLESPEQLQPEENQTKWSASALYTRTLDGQRALSVTAAWGRRISDHVGLDAWALEAASNPARAWTVFARAERTDNNELLSAAGVHGEPHTVAKVSVGALRDSPSRAMPHLASAHCSRSIPSTMHWTRSTAPARPVEWYSSGYASTDRGAWRCQGRRPR